MTCKNRFLGVYSYFGFVNEIIVTAPPVLADPSFLRLLFENKQNKCEYIRSTGITNIRAFPFFIHLHCIPLIVFSLFKTSAFGFRLLIGFSRISLSISHRFFLLLFVLIIFKTWFFCFVSKEISFVFFDDPNTFCTLLHVFFSNEEERGNLFSNCLFYL